MKALQTQYGGWRFPVRLSSAQPLLNCAFVLQAVQIWAVSGLSTGDLGLVLEEVITTGEGLEIPVLTLSTGRVADEGDAARTAQTMGRVYQRVLCATGCPMNSQAALKQVYLSCLSQSTSDFA